MSFVPATRVSPAARAEAALKTALADPAILMVNRNAGSGTRVLVDSLLRGARPAGYANQPRSHNAVAAAIAQTPRRLGRGDRAGGAHVWARLPADRAGAL